MPAEKARFPDPVKTMALTETPLVAASSTYRRIAVQSSGRSAFAFCSRKIVIQHAASAFFMEMFDDIRPPLSSLSFCLVHKVDVGDDSPTHVDYAAQGHSNNSRMKEI